MELTAALRQVNTLLINKRGAGLRDPETIILQGTWQGLTYEKMAEGSEYSVNYLMRDIAPKLWRHLSSTLNRSVGKTNFRAALENFAEANLSAEADELGALDSDWLSEVVEDDNRSQSVPAEVPISSASASSTLYGYESELAQVTRWLGTGRTNLLDAARALKENGSPVRIIGLWGLKGIGKSLLCETAVAQADAQFELVIRSAFKEDCSLDDFCASILASLEINFQLKQAAATLLTVLSQRQLLLVFEGIEAIFQPGGLAGEYLLSHQNYRDFFQSALATSRSCILITGTESPVDWVSQDGHNRALRSLLLSGLDNAAATELLAGESLQPSEHWPELIEHYQGHPLALKSAARVIREMFNGRVDSFLDQTTAPLNSTLHLLSPVFERLSDSENNVLYWLASQDGPLSLAALQQTVQPTQGGTALISVLDSLKQRSLLSVQVTSEHPTFELPALVKSCAVQQLLAKMTAGDTGTHSQHIPTPAQFLNASRQNLLTLSSPVAQPAHLSQWVAGRFTADWHSLNQLFGGAARPTVRLRNTYHLRNETFTKRYKSIALSGGVGSLKGRAEGPESGATEVIVLVAVSQQAEGLYEICVQVQPAKEEKALPEAIALKLLDDQQSVLAEVNASQSDTFLQLPYFLGKQNESFSVELSLSHRHHRETFLV